MVARPLDLVIVLVAGAAALLVGLAARRRSEGGGRPGLKHLAWPVLVVLADTALGLKLGDRPESSNDATDLPRIRPDLDFLDGQTLDADIRWPYFAIDRTEELRDGTYRPYLNAITRGLYTQQPVIGHGAGGWWLQQSDVIHDGDEL